MKPHALILPSKRSFIRGSAALITSSLLLPRKSRAWTHGGGGGGGGYVAKAVHFDGATWLRTALLTASNSAVCTFSGWAKANLSAVAHNQNLFDFDPASFEFGPSFGTIIMPTANIYFPSVDGNSTVTRLNNTDAPWNDSTWNHIFCYVDAGHAAGAKVLEMFINTVSIGGTLTDDNDAFIIPFSNSLAVPDTDEDLSLPELIGDMADWWIAPGVLNTDITVFRDPVTGKPKNPSGFPTGAVLFSGDATGFAVNQGTGGPFVLTGTLTNASTSPSD